MFAGRRRLAVLFTSNSSALIVAGRRYVGEYKSHEGSKYMQKLLCKKDGRAKKKWYQSHIAEPTEVFAIKGPANTHRMTQAQSVRAKQLGHVLYDKIIQIMNTGELSEEILNMQVLVTSVKMQPDFGGINVYWDSCRSDSAEIESLLLAHARKLRSLLISYHVLGRIPPITFVKDKSMSNLTQLTQLLEVADYGPDYVPSSQHKNNMTSAFSTRWGSLENNSSKANANITYGAALPKPDSTQAHEVTNFTKCTANLNNNEISYDGSETVQSPSLENQAVDLMQGLKFRSNLYSLPHEDIMRKVTANRVKVKYQDSETSSSTAADTSSFDIKQLHSRKDKMKPVSFSTKQKQQLLEMDAEDFMSMTSGNGDHLDEAQDEEYDDDDDDELNRN